MRCYIYKSSVRKETYLYLPIRDEFSQVPESLLQLFGTPEFAFDFQLTVEKKLFQEDVEIVRQNLADQGYHLQMPKKDIEIFLDSQLR